MSHSVSQPTMYAGGQALPPAPSPMAHSPSLSNIQPIQGLTPDHFAELFSWGLKMYSDLHNFFTHSLSHRNSNLVRCCVCPNWLCRIPEYGDRPFGSVADPDPHSFWSAGSGSALGIRFRIQEGQNYPQKGRKKIQVLKWWMFSFEGWRLQL